MELFLFFDAQNMSRDRTSTLSDRVKEQKFLLGWFKGKSISGGATELTRVSRPPPKNHAWSKRVNNSRTRFQYFIFHVQFFFFFYIYSHIESVDIHSWQIRKNWFQNRNRSLCELCIQGAICKKHTCRVVFCSILYTSLSVFCFCSYYPSFRIAWIRICFSFSLFRSLPFFLPFRYFFFIWTVVHLIGCTGLLGTDNWLANNSSNNIRAYDIQVLIYTLHRYFFVFVFRSNHIFGACSVCLRVYVSLCVQVPICCPMRDALSCFETCAPVSLFFSDWSIYARLEFKYHNSIK